MFYSVEHTRRLSRSWIVTSYMRLPPQSARSIQRNLCKLLKQPETTPYSAQTEPDRVYWLVPDRLF